MLQRLRKTRIEVKYDLCLELRFPVAIGNDLDLYIALSGNGLFPQVANMALKSLFVVAEI